MADNTSIPIIVQGNSFSLAIPLQIYVIDDNEMVLEDYTPDPTDEVTIQLKGSRRNYTYTPTIDGNIANIDLGGYELADNYAVVVSIVKQDGKRLRSFRTDQFFIVESSDDLTQDDIIAGLEENVIYLNAQAFIAGADGRGITSIVKTSTAGLVDTYTIIYTDNTTTTFQVTNGQQGEQGTGITSIEKTATVGLVDTYTITLSNGSTSTFEVTNGQDAHDLGLAVIVNDLITGGVEDALSAAQGKELNTLLHIDDKGNYTTARVSTTYSRWYDLGSDGNRIRYYKPVVAGEKILVNCSYSYGVQVALFANIQSALHFSAADIVQDFTSATYKTGTIYAVPNSAGVLCVTTRKSDGNNITDAQLAEITAQIEIKEFIAQSIEDTPKKDSDKLVKSGGILDAINNHSNGFYITTPNDIVTHTPTILPSNIHSDYPSGFQSNMTRIRVMYNVGQDYKVTASCSLGKGINMNLYGTREEAIYAAPIINTTTQVAIQIIDGTAYSTEREQATINKDGILSISLCKSDNSAFTQAEYDAYLAALDVSIRVEGLRDVIEQEKEELFIGTLVQKSITASGLSDTNASYRVSSATNMVLPKENATLRFKFPSWLKVGIREGAVADNLNNNNYWFYDGDTFTFRDGMCFFRMSFAKLDTNETISVAEVEDAIAKSELKIFVDGNKTDIVTRNRENEKYAKAVMRKFVSGIANNSGLHLMPVFAHTSDIHGDATRFNSFADYCDFLGVDAGLVSGDMVAKTPSDMMQYVNDIADTHNTMLLPCMGNHDARGLTTAESQNAELSHLITKYSLSTNSSETYPTYYYKDFASKKIRLISINLYELSHTNDNVNFTQAQCTWLVATLASTPANYGVLLMLHSPEKMPSKDNDHSAFYQDINNYDYLQQNISGYPFAQIVDAFIGKTSATINYSIGSTSISVSADFTGVASGVEFIAYVNGHLHVDRIGYVPSTTYKQLVLNVTCCIAIYGGSSNPYYADPSDLSRGCEGSTQDAFNIYAIDRASKVVRVARIGSNIAGNLTERKFMVIPYAD